MPTIPTTLRYSATNGASSGITVATGATAWLYGSWTILDTSLSEDVWVSGVTYQINSVGATDTTREFIMDFGIGNNGNQIVELQVPISQRVTTAVGIYLESPHLFSLPEPMAIRANSQIWVRAATGMTGAQTISGVKLIFQSALYQQPFSNNAYGENYKRLRTPNGISSGIGGTM